MIKLNVSPSGTVKCLYTESINLSAFGTVSIKRASHVEPEADGSWSADMSPVGGEKLTGFKKRSDALAAEKTWLEARLGSL